MLIKKKNYVVSFDPSGHLIGIENFLTGEFYKINEGSDSVSLDSGILYAESCMEIKQALDENQALSSVTFVYESGIRIQWTFGDEHLEKTLFFTPQTDCFIDKVSVFSPTIPECGEIHFHDDCTIWHCPLCYYARFPLGGLFFGLAYPYWDEITDGRLSFSPKIKCAAEETFEAERVFIGVYRKEEKTISTHGPYPGKRKQKYTDIFNIQRVGLAQHFPGNVIPEDVGIPEEELNLGEIRAMQRFFRSYLEEMPLPEEGFFVWQNGWWANLTSPDPDCLLPLKDAGITDIMTAAMYYGHDSHPSTEPKYICNTSIEPFGFPVDANSASEVVAIRDGFHHDVEVTEETDTVDSEYTPIFSAPPDYDALIRYGEEIGIHVSSFSTPNNAYKHAPQWDALDENGEPYGYFGTKLSCPACRDYMDHHFRTLSAIFDRYHPRLWPFDGRWMGYNEIALGNPVVGENPCYAGNHGHLPGESRYIEWKNIEEFKRRLRERYPTMCFENYYGMKRGSTWSLRYFNSDENYYECSCVDDNRFQAWHNEMDRFRPTYMQYAPLMGMTPTEFEYSMLSAMSVASYAQCAFAYKALASDPTCVAIFRKWKQWADENHRFLKQRENLFGCPGDVAIDGSAHLIDGEGYVFLFCTTDEAGETELVFSDLYGLDRDTDYTVTAVHSTATVAEEVLGTLSAERNIPIRMEAHTAMLLRIDRVK